MKAFTKHSYLELLKNPDNVDLKEIGIVEKILSKAPYCQTTHCLFAKIAYLKKNPNAKEIIRRAGLYVADKPKLKEYILSAQRATSSTQTIQEVPENQKKSEEHLSIEKTSTETRTINETPINTSSDNLNLHLSIEAFDKFTKELSQDLEVMDVSRKKFFTLQENIEDIKPKGKTRKNPTIKKTTSKKLPRTKTIEKKPSSTVTRKKIVESPKKTSTVSRTKKATSSAKSRTSSKTPSSQKKNDIKKKVSASTKAVTVFDMIDDFIVKNPTITKQEVLIASKENLSEKSGNLDESLYTEQLAEIFLAQNNKAKAKEIYSYLMSKNSKKKKYFTKLIEENCQ